MELPVLIQPLPDRPGYTARLGAPFNLTAEAATADEARRQLIGLLDQQLQQGAEIRSIVVPGAPGTTAGGWLPDDELTREWLEQVRQYRQECHEADARRLDDAGEGKAAS